MYATRIRRTAALWSQHGATCRHHRQRTAARGLVAPPTAPAQRLWALVTCRVRVSIQTRARSSSRVAIRRRRRPGGRYPFQTARTAGCSLQRIIRACAQCRAALRRVDRAAITRSFTAAAHRSSIPQPRHRHRLRPQRLRGRRLHAASDGLTAWRFLANATSGMGRTRRKAARRSTAPPSAASSCA